MKRAEFEHAIRAAGGILDTTEPVVIGSQAIHATVSGDLPEEAQRSIEVDIGPHTLPEACARGGGARCSSDA